MRVLIDGHWSTKRDVFVDVASCGPHLSVCAGSTNVYLLQKKPRPNLSSIPKSPAYRVRGPPSPTSCSTTCWPSPPSLTRTYVWYRRSLVSARGPSYSAARSSFAAHLLHARRRLHGAALPRRPPGALQGENNLLAECSVRSRLLPLSRGTNVQATHAGLHH
jgi:hypothetical protein